MLALTYSQTGFTAIVDKALSAKYEKLVNDAPELIKVLPWGEDFEVDVFRKPDFTALEVLTFATGGIPAGINVSRKISFVGDNRVEHAFLDPQLLRDPRGSRVQERLAGCKYMLTFQERIISPRGFRTFLQPRHRVSDLFHRSACSTVLNDCYR